MFETVARCLAEEVSADNALKELREIQSRDRWFTFPKFLESATYEVSRFAEYGLKDARVIKFPADGKTTFGDWIMPLSWDVKSARLTVTSPESLAGPYGRPVLAGEVLADYQEVPCSLAMWSAPTPEEGVEAELIILDKPGAIEKFDVKGKIIFTSDRAKNLKHEAARRGALGILSDNVPNPEATPRARFWMNAFSDDPGGWGHIAGDSQIFAFNISPQAGKRLRDIIAKGEKIRLKAAVQSRIYEGEMPIATASIPGETDEEVLVLGHGFEQGANDNASGCAVIMEVARALSALIKEGKLARPRRSIRFLITNECYGTLGFATLHKAIIERTVVGLNLDCVGENQAVCESILGVHKNPHSLASFTDTLIKRIIRYQFAKNMPDFRWEVKPFAITDAIIADPLIGVPCPYLGQVDKFWHTNEDTVDKVDKEVLRNMAAAAGTYLYFLATAEGSEARYLAQAAYEDASIEIDKETENWRNKISEAKEATEIAKALSWGAKRLRFIAQREARRIHSAASLSRDDKALSTDIEGLIIRLKTQAEKGAKDLKVEAVKRANILRQPLPALEKDPSLEGARKMIPKRTCIGNLSLDVVPQEKREGNKSPRWSREITAAVFWTDGKRNLAEITELTRLELNRPRLDFVEYFEFLERSSLMEIERK